MNSLARSIFSPILAAVLRDYYFGFAAKSFSWGQGVGCGVWGFTSFEVANYLIFREKVQEFSP
ncbi:type IV pilin PilA [Microcystis sp. 0824]|nr:type IV pilin PilA [Microcystis sp. 0824]